MKYICFQIYLELIETFISYFEKKKKFIHPVWSRLATHAMTS